ncbi:MAG: sensor histidine kinase [Bacteroides sp.]|nr:sensor histidine kinase [Bacteroides sp.]
MEVEIPQAIKMFFSSSSFEMIYLEAFANALDAGANKFEINVKLDSYNNLSSLEIVMKDNGEGFTDIRFDKFSRLLSVEDKSHKGLGRLVYLCYFDNVDIESTFDDTKHRTFTFHSQYVKESMVTEVNKKKSGSVLKLKDFNNIRLHKNDYVRAFYIKKILLENFYMKFLTAKLINKEIKVTIKTEIGGKSEKENITNADIPNFSLYQIPTADDLFEELTVYYHISKHTDNARHSTFISAFAIDDRSMSMDIMSKENISSSYDMIFLLKSDSLIGSSDPSRQNIKIEDGKLNSLKEIFRKAINKIVSQEIPTIAKKNKRQFNVITRRFPHLAGLIDEDCVGILSYNDVLKRAQDKYFRTERELLGAEKLSEEQYNKSLEYSSRSLANYVIYREKVIRKLLSLSGEETEIDLHNLLCPRYNTFKKDDVIDDIYANNIWVLDDKFMSYDTVLSEAEMSDVLKVLDPECPIIDDDRPDISVFFSRNPKDENSYFDIVIVELKRLGIKAENSSIVEFQLDTRTQRLAEFFGNRIRNAWFYGVVDFTPKYELHLKNEFFHKQFSHGKVWHRSKDIYADVNSVIPVKQEAFIMDFKALVEDAAARNQTFLKILQKKISEDTTI